MNRSTMPPGQGGFGSAAHGPVVPAVQQLLDAVGVATVRSVQLAGTALRTAVTIPAAFTEPVLVTAKDIA